MLRMLSTALSSRLRRVTSGQNYVPEIDGVRFVAIASVLVQHLHERIIRRAAVDYPDVSEHAFHTAGAGVSIFFALSGLILYRGLMNSLQRHGDLNLKSYFLRRITRLEPPYVVVMTAIFLYVSIVGYQSAHLRRFNAEPESLFVSFLASLTYTHCMLFGSLPRLNGVAWSLEIEVQYYVLAPVLALLLTKSGLRHGAVLLFVAAILWAGFITPLAFSNLHTRYSLLTSFPYFLVGMSVEELCRAPGQSFFKKIPGWGADLIGLLSFAALVLLHLPQDSAQSVCLKTVFVMLALWGMLHGLVWRRFLSLSWISVIGGMCYSIYLLHMPVLEVCANLTTQVGRGLPYSMYFVVQGVLLLSAVVVASTVLYILVERPCMNKNWPTELYCWLRGSQGREQNRSR